jgi:hypothetical protein
MNYLVMRRSLLAKRRTHPGHTPSPRDDNQDDDQRPEALV